MTGSKKVYLRELVGRARLGEDELRDVMRQVRGASGQTVIRRSFSLSPLEQLFKAQFVRAVASR